MNILTQQQNKKKWINTFWYYSEKLSFIFFIFFILTFTFERRHIPNLNQVMIGDSVNEWLTISIYISDLFLFSMLVFGARALYMRLKQTNTAQKILSLLLIFSMLASSVFSLSSPSAVIVFSALKLTSGVLIFIYLSTLQSLRRIHIAFAILSLVGAAQSLLGIVQFALQKSTGLRVLGETIFSPLSTNIAEITINTIQYIRPPGTFTHANVFGMFLVLSWITSAVYLRATALSNNRGWTHYSKIWITLSGLIITPGILLSFSRSAYIAFGLSLILLIFNVIRSKTGEAFKIFVYASFALSILLSLILSPVIVPRGTNIESGGDQALSSRISRTEDAVSIIADSPLIGQGAGSYVPESLMRFPEREPWEYQPVHNYLVVISEIGVIGGLILAILIFCMYPKIKNTDIQIPSIALTTILICMIAFDHYFWTIHQGIYLFWITISILALIKRIHVLRETK